MTELRKYRWVRVHEQGDANFVGSDNVMDITVGEGLCRAEVNYTAKTVKSFKKVAYWLERYLANAAALQTIAENALVQIKDAAESSTDDIQLSGDGWSCSITKMSDDGGFYVQLNWSVADEVTEETPASVEEVKPKKRGRKKKEVTQ